MSFRFIDFEELKEIIIKQGYKAFHMHHTWKPSHRHFKPGTHIQMQKNMERYHMEVNGWSSIGQHITVFPDGKIVTGRAFNRTPASIKNNNAGAFCMEMLGNFNSDGDKLEGEQLKTVLLILNLFLELGIKVYFHRDKHTWHTCPGDTLEKECMIAVAKEIHNISDWALDWWFRAVCLKITDGSFPKGYLTREMKVTMDGRMGLYD